MTTGAGIVLALIVAGVIAFDIFLLGRHFDRRIDAADPEQDRYND